MNNFEKIIYLIFTHVLGDFFCQSNKMATKKSHSILWLSIHIIVYSLILFSFSLLLFDLSFLFKFTVLNGVSHFAIDFVTSKTMKKLDSAGKIYNYFIVIVLDQFLHQAILIATIPK